MTPTISQSFPLPRFFILINSYNNCFLQNIKSGHKCCSDNPLLTNINLTKSIENWNGEKRCCFSETEERQLDRIQNLTDEDKVEIDKKLSESSDKRVRRSIHKKNIFLYTSFSPLEYSRIYTTLINDQ